MTTKRRSEVLADTLSELMAASADIEGAVIVSHDGLVMASNLPKGADANRVAAWAAAMMGLSKRTTLALGRGEFTESMIQGENGDVIIVSAGERAVFVGLM
jgi:predicted regulator of Ras-like GTPase activity (Roadblock/LC7/MglB family)